MSLTAGQMAAGPPSCSQNTKGNHLFKGSILSFTISLKINALNNLIYAPLKYFCFIRLIDSKDSEIRK